jgi:hypothetical protein
MNKQTLEYAIRFLMKVVILSSHWTGIIRKQELTVIESMPVDQKDKELVFLRERVRLLETQVSILKKQNQKRTKTPRYSLREQIFIMASLEYFRIPRRRVTEYFGISRSNFPRK